MGKLKREAKAGQICGCNQQVCQQAVEVSEVAQRQEERVKGARSQGWGQQSKKGVDQVGRELETQ